SRLLTLAEEAGDDADKCFLTGTLLLLNKDRTRALAFLVRAEELAGTDAQAALLADSDADDRNEARGKTALNAGEWDEAARSFTFAALESPAVPPARRCRQVPLRAQGMRAHAYSLC